MATLMALASQAGSMIGSAFGGGAVANTVGTSLATTALGAGANKMMKSMTPKVPQPESPKAMPTPDDENMRAAQRQSLAKQKMKGGRKSTVMTALDGGGLGG